MEKNEIQLSGEIVEIQKLAHLLQWFDDLLKLDRYTVYLSYNIAGSYRRFFPIGIKRYSCFSICFFKI